VSLIQHHLNRLLTGASEVEAVEETNVGYSKAADLWSLGVLTACLFTGNIIIPRDELAGLSQAEIATQFLDADDRHVRAQWQQIPPRALRFIRRLLIVDPDERMTINEALDHSWYSKPPREAKALKEALERINRFWKPREKDNTVIEALPPVSINIPSIPERQVVKLRKRVPDASLSPYFGLDRHLLQRMPSTRKRILEDLNESGSQFINATNLKMGTAENCIEKRGDRSADKVMSVDGGDLFGMCQEGRSTMQSGSDLDEVGQTLFNWKTESRIDSGMDPDDTIYTLGPSTAISMHSIEPSIYKRVRKESDEEDKRVHDIAARELPRLSTAKALKEAVCKLKGIGINHERQAHVTAA
jgi:serine/threonine protein kinase